MYEAKSMQEDWVLGLTLCLAVVVATYETAPWQHKRDSRDSFAIVLVP